MRLPLTAALALTACAPGETLDLSQVVVAITPVDPTTATALTAGAASRTGETVPPYALTWYVNGVLDTDRTDAPSIAAEDTTKGDFYRADFTFEDGQVLTATTEILNTPPTVTVTLPAATAPVDADLTATATATDLDGDAVSLSWSWTRDDELVDEATSDTVPALRTAAGEVWTVLVLGNDGEEDGDEATASLTIYNSDPVVTSVGILPAVPSTQDNLTAAVVATDPDGDALDLSYTWRRDGVVVQTGGDTVASTQTAKGQFWTVEVEATDGTGTSAAVLSGGVTIANGLPSLTGAQITPATPDEHSEVTCEGVGWADDDGDPDQSTVAWTLNGLVLGATGPVTGATFDRDDVLGCTLTPFDGEDVGTPVVATPVTVGNAPPELSLTDLSPDPPHEGDTLTPVYTATDPDGDALDLTVDWYVDSVLAHTGPSLTSTHFAKNQTIWAVVTATDPLGAEVSSTSPVVVVANTPPQITSLALSPATPVTDDVVTAVIGTTDLDGDARTVTYQWFVNNTLVRPPDDDPTLDGATNFLRGDSLLVIATAHDGTAASLPVDAVPVTVVNRVPDPPTIVINPDPLRPDEDGLCLITDVPFDPDGDAITYAITWTLDGATVGAPLSTTNVSGDTLGAAALDDGETAVCIATADDGYATSEPATATAPVAALGNHPGHPAVDCAHLLAERPTAPDGDYWIDPDNDGEALLVACDMFTDGGGWTRVHHDDFEDGDTTGWNLSTTTTCPGWSGTLLGGYGAFSGGTASRLIDLLTIVHDDVRVTAQLAALDSWEDEVVRLQVDGVDAWSASHWTIYDAVANTCGYAGAMDAWLEADGVVPSDTDVVTLSVVSELDEAATNESLGVEWISVWAR